MSLETTPSAPATPLPAQTRGRRMQVKRKLKLACDAMVWQGLPFDQAAKSVNYPIQSMRSALERAHVAAYIRHQRQVFRASLVDEATFRMRALSQQDDNRAAAVTATARLMSEVDEQVNRSTERSSPGVVIIIQTPDTKPDDTPPLTISASYSTDSRHEP